MAMPESIIRRWNKMTEEEQKETVVFIDYLLLKRNSVMSRRTSIEQDAQTDGLVGIINENQAPGVFAKPEKAATRKSMRGILEHYADPKLANREKGAWERAAAEKYGSI